jgi:signal transduction histidine kinase
MKSLRRNLLLWLLPATFLVGVLASIGTYWGDYLKLESILDNQLRYIAEHINLSEANQVISLQHTNPSQRSESEEKKDEVLLEVWEGKHRIFSTHPSLHFLPPTSAGFINQTYNKEVWHTFVTRQDNKWIRIGQAQNTRFEALADLSIHLFWPVIGMLPLLAVFLWYGISYGLRPLDHISQELKKRHAKSMTPVIPKQEVIEIQPFVEVLNDLLERLNESFVAQEHFIADAAHELRTPVMGLLIEIDVMSRESDLDKQKRSLRHLKLNAERLSHLVHQLLTLAASDSKPSVDVFEIVNLTDLAKSVIAELATIAAKRNIDLGITTAEIAEIQGNADHLKILVTNLVDNALRYVQEGGQVDVSIIKEQAEIVLKVQDNGPGIPKNEREKVLQRFYRGKHQAIPGSGLGLSIVKQIAEQHQAELNLHEGENGAGLCISIAFKSPAT